MLRRRPTSALSTLIPIALALALTLTACGGDEGDAPANGAGEPSVSPSSTNEPVSDACAYTEQPPAAKEGVQPPSGEPATGEQKATLVTNRGDLTIDLDTDLAPCTVANFQSLAEQKYYDGTSCHRLTTGGIFVLQCGDPTNSGAGGPGYTFPDEVDQLPKTLQCKGSACIYPAGTVAMANAGPNTNGSQFFLVYDASPLAPAYTVFGKLTPESLKIVQKVAQAGTAEGGSDGVPASTVTITQVR